ncbi:putative ubiquitin-protein ligase-like [Trypanosoma grayi]|uniref:putative ubiquitin-protein ligase-like n=1 Tax=Trypanosoma grayi TaxID=71804 RepID=UPI0004F43C29|nr:putative ubiquitin-protein ligase-like [Trypanosoma grayi]KEG10041.1 putative ubiquitin-protein ligase-like [Trypanosoma grayi]
MAAALRAQMCQFSHFNQWQEAICLLTSSLALSSSEAENVGTGIPSTTHTACEFLIAALLYNGHGESAFAVWRSLSAAFNFAPSQMLMMKLAVYTLLMDGQTQEALDLSAMASFSVENKDMDNKLSLEHFELWTAFYAALLSTKGAEPTGPNAEIEGKVKEMLFRLLRLVERSSDGKATQSSLEKLQLTLHAVFSLMSVGYGEELLHKIIAASSNERNNTDIDSLLCVAELIFFGHGKAGVSGFFSPTVLPFLLTHLFPVPLACSLRECTPILSGLVTYQSFFSGIDGDLSSHVVEGSSPPIVIHTTLGNMFLLRLQNHDLLKPFLHSVVSYDLAAMNASLMTHVLESILWTEATDVLGCAVGQQLLSVVEGALSDDIGSGTRHLLAMKYVSCVLTPFVNSKSPRRQTGIRNGGDNIPLSGVFCVELLNSLIATVPSADRKAWRRFVDCLTNTLLEGLEVGPRTAIPLALRLQLHASWWLPDLLATVDVTRERLLCLEFQQRVQRKSATEEWDSSACAILRALHEEDHCDRSTNPVQLSHDDDSTMRYTHGNTTKGGPTVADPPHGIQPILVKRFVRWEWLLNGLWQLAHETEHEMRYSLWQNLIEVCTSTLSHCRSFHRHDIARDLVETLLLPAGPFLGLGAPYSCGIRIGSGSDITITSSSLIVLLIAYPTKNLTGITTVLKLQWNFMDEVSRWLPTLNAWGTMRELQELFPPGPHGNSREVLLLKHLIDDASLGLSKNKTLNANGRRRVRELFNWYEELCRNDISLRTPQLLVPLARALRRADLVDCLSLLLENVFADLQKGFQGPRQSSTSRMVEERLLFLHAYHSAAVAQMTNRDGADVGVELTRGAHGTGVGIVAALAETYIFSLWEHGHLFELGSMLLKPPLTSLSASPYQFPQAVKDMNSFYVSAEVVFLLPLAEREAMRLFLLMFLAQRCSNSSYLIALQQLPRFRADTARVVSSVEHLVAREKHIFAPFANEAQQVAKGSLELRDACAAIVSGRVGGGTNNHTTTTDDGIKMGVRTVRDLNRCIDRGDWVASLRAVPHVLSVPLHRARKALLACERAPKGTPWEGAMSIIANARRTWQCQERQEFGELPHFCADVGLPECGRAMTLLADAKRWREALRLFESLGSHGVDGYIFTQTCFALRTGGRPELAVDLWAMWRAAVGDAVMPTAQMCGQFLRCGVVGKTIVADAACSMLKEAAAQAPRAGVEGPSLPELEKTPGTTLPLLFEKEEEAITVLLRDRWHESWQKALQVALVSGRSRIIQEVARDSPSNHRLYEAVMQHATRVRRNLSSEERKAIVGHLDVREALATEDGSARARDDRAARVLQELLGGGGEN